MFHQRIKCQLDRNARIEHHHFAAGAQHIEAEMGTQKLSHRLSPRSTDHGEFILHGIFQRRIVSDGNICVHHAGDQKISFGRSFCLCLITVVPMNINSQ